MKAFAGDFPRQAHEIKKAAALEFLTHVVPDTPVLSGQARSNYIVSIGSPSTRIRTNIDRAGTVSLREGAATLRLSKPGVNIWISNALPYIGRLNDGYSKQAPAGFIQAALKSALGVIARQSIRYRVREADVRNAFDGN